MNSEVLQRSSRKQTQSIRRAGIAGARTVGINNYHEDPLYPRIVRAVDALLVHGIVVAPVDVLIEMDMLDKRCLEQWRCGLVTYLERVNHGNLTRLSRLLRILRCHAHDLNLVPSIAVYVRSGKGPRQHLRFTKTGERKLEDAWARHFVWPGNRPFHLPASRQATDLPVRPASPDQPKRDT